MIDAWEPLDDCVCCHSYITMAMTQTDRFFFAFTPLQPLNQGSIVCPESSNRSPGR